MIKKKVIIFGASGQIGRNIIRKITLKNYKVTAVTRNAHKSIFLKTQAPLGYLDIIEENIFNEKVLEELIGSHDICINLIGILFEKKKNTFKNIHINFPSLLSKICKKKNIDQFIHISALGVENVKDSEYAKSKYDGEKIVKENFEKTTILKPSIVYSQDDNFSTRFLSLLSFFPIFPIFENPKFSPIHCKDLSEIIVGLIEKNICSEIIECPGPQIIYFKEILQILSKSINKKRLFIPIPNQLGKIFAKSSEILPSPLITLDQLRLLKYHNVKTGKHKTNRDFGLNADLKFENEIKKYSYMWTERGEYSRN
jgi:uncharacterized protein YbjT (DUF2867 family)